ncbi:MAG TPA: hypothetical protein VFO01_12925 [Trebonia sp.]|nr:hypothetical protein [Trebonia sp.]
MSSTASTSASVAPSPASELTKYAQSPGVPASTTVYWPDSEIR